MSREIADNILFYLKLFRVVICLCVIRLQQFEFLNIIRYTRYSTHSQNGCFFSDFVMPLTK